MPRWVKWLLGVVAALLVVLVVGRGAALPYLVDTPRIQAYIATTATQALGRPVKFSSVSLRVLPLPAVELHELEVAEDPEVRHRAVPQARHRPRPAAAAGRCSRAGSSWATSCCASRSSRSSRPPTAASTSPRSAPTTEPRPAPAGALAPGGGGRRRPARRLAPRVLVDDGSRDLRRPRQGRGGSRSTGSSDLDVTLTGGGHPDRVQGRRAPAAGRRAAHAERRLVALGSAQDAHRGARCAARSRSTARTSGAAGGGRDRARRPRSAARLKGTLALGGTVAAPTAAGEVADLQAHRDPDESAAVPSPSGGR